MTTIYIAVYCKRTIANKMINPGQKKKDYYTFLVEKNQQENQAESWYVWRLFLNTNYK